MVLQEHIHPDPLGHGMGESGDVHEDGNVLALDSVEGDGGLEHPYAYYPLVVNSNLHQHERNFEIHFRILLGIEFFFP